MTRDDWLAKLSDSSLWREQGFIDGAWVDPDEGGRFSVHDPSSLETIAAVPDMGAHETERAIDAAEVAFSAWRKTTGAERAGALRNWRELIARNREDLARILTAEQGKPLAEAIGEIKYAEGFLEWFEGEAVRIDGEVISTSMRSKRVLVQKHPVGVVAAITPWNFPAAMITRKAGAALAAGCTVVLKPSELTPLTALALMDLADRAGMPAGVLNVVTGQPQAIGAKLCSDPRVRKLTFTGSTPVGKMLAAQCAPTLKRLSLELGGNAAFIVFDDADLDRAVEAVMTSKFRNSGQTCVCANRLLVQSGIEAAFIERLRLAMAKLVTGPGINPINAIGPLVDASAFNKVNDLVEDAIANGAQSVAGGNRLPDAGAGYYFAPTLLKGANLDMRLAREEIFGPVAPVFTFETEEEAIALANDVASGLAAYVATSSLERTFRLADELEAGMVGVNTGAISDPIVPFGGIKESGYGREGSKHGIEEYLHLKSVTIGLE